MKKFPLLLAAFITLSPAKIFSQNLVPNPSFEQYSTCPSALDQLSLAQGWSKVGAPSTDYYNTCAGISGISAVPTNNFGTQMPANGNAYIGLYTYSGTTTYKELARTNITAMIPGAEYEVVVFVSLADLSGWGTDDIGVEFAGGMAFPNIAKPQVIYDQYGPITDKTNWVRLADTFITPVNYSQITIGGFKNNSVMNKTATLPNPNNTAYYYLDNVSIVQLSDFQFMFYDTMLCAGDTIKIPYTMKPGSYAVNNTITAYLSDATGSFSNAVAIGTKLSNVSDTIKAVIPLSTPTGGGYRLRLTSSNPARIASTYPINIGIGNSKPAKPEAGGESLVCSDDTLHLTATSATPGVSWKWVGPNSYNSNEQNPVRIHPNPVGPGFYYVTAYIYGCESSDTLPVIAARAPFVPSLLPVGSICEGDTIKLSYVGSAFTGTTFSWTGPNNFTATGATQAIPNSTQAMNGNYIITAHLQGCYKYDTATVVVKPLPQVSATNNGPLCTGANLNLSLSGTTGSTYVWTGPGLFGSVLAFPSRFNMSQTWAGDYVVEASLNGCKAYDTTFVFVYAPTAKPTASSNSPVCVGGDIELKATEVPGTTYEWGGVNLFYANTKDAVKTNAALNEAGKYYVKAISGNGCSSDWDTVLVTINLGPKVLIYPNPNDSICPSWKAGFAAVHQNGGPAPTFYWYRNGVYTGATNHNYVSPTVATGDSFYVRMTAGSACNTPITSNSIKITVLPVHTPPTVTVTANPGPHAWPNVMVTFKAKSGNAGANPGYQWVRNGWDISKANDSVYTTDDLKTGDTIWCRVTSNFLCAEPREVPSNKVVMYMDAGIHDNMAERNIELYPNPNSGSFSLQLNTIAGDKVNIGIYDQLGKLVYSETTQAASPEFRKDINLGQQPAGVYYLRVTTDSGNYQSRFVVR